MREHLANIKFLPVEVQNTDDTKVVSTNVKNRERRHIVRRVKDFFDLKVTQKIRRFDKPIPCLQRHSGAGVFKPEGFQCIFGNDVHAAMI